MADKFTLDQIASALAGLPSTGFRARLKAELERRTGMTAATPAIKPGFRSLTPYLIVDGAARLIDFLKKAFHATEAFRVPRPDGSVMHAQIEIAGSVIELSDASKEFPSRTTGLHFYVPDAGAVYQRAIAEGAVSLYGMTDQPYGDREGSVKDPGGNQWYIGTNKAGPGYRYQGLTQDVTIYLHPHGADRMIDFLKQAFDAREIEVHRSPNGVVHHAKVAIGDSALELGEAHGDWQPMPTGIHFYVDDCESVYQRALAAGAESLWPVADQPYGERSGGVRDPFGNSWFIATYTGRVQS